MKASYKFTFISGLLISVVLVLIKISHSNTNQVAEEPLCKVRVVLAYNNIDIAEQIVTYLDYLDSYSSAVGMDFKFSEVSTIEPKYSINILGEHFEILGTNPFRNAEFRFGVFSGKPFSSNEYEAYQEFISSNKMFEGTRSVSDECLKVIGNGNG